MRNVVVFANDMKVADQWLRSSYSGVGRFFICTSFGDITDILDKCEDEDIEGIILPCARTNPELPQILRIIYDRKFHLYKTHVIPRINVVDFLLMAERRLGVDLQNR